MVIVLSSQQNHCKSSHTVHVINAERRRNDQPLDQALCHQSAYRLLVLVTVVHCGT